MVDFAGEDLSGLRFEPVDLTGAEFRAADLSHSRFRGVDLRAVVMRGVEVVDVRIDGGTQNLLVNGVDIAPVSTPSPTGATPIGSGCALADGDRANGHRRPTDESLPSHTEPVEGAGWPPPESSPVRECLLIVLNEEWHHRQFAERDLDALEAGVKRQGN